MLALCWPYMLALSWSMLAMSWPYVGPMLAYVGPITPSKTKSTISLLAVFLPMIKTQQVSMMSSLQHQHPSRTQSAISLLAVSLIPMIQTQQCRRFSINTTPESNQSNHYTSASFWIDSQLAAKSSFQASEIGACATSKQRATEGWIGPGTGGPYCLTPLSEPTANQAAKSSFQASPTTNEPSRFQIGPLLHTEAPWQWRTDSACGLQLTGAKRHFLNPKETSPKLLPQASGTDPFATLKHHGSEGWTAPAACSWPCQTSLSESTRNEFQTVCLVFCLLAFFFCLLLFLPCSCNLLPPFQPASSLLASFLLSALSLSLSPSLSLSLLVLHLASSL